MTAPNSSAPDGAYVVGGRYGQDITTASAYAAMRGQRLNGFENAQDSWREMVSDISGLSDQIRDGQLELTDRLDLLEGVTGYCSTFLSKNWDLVQNVLLTLPFDSQLGPARGAIPFDNGIRLQSKGLWRADCHITAEKMTSSNFIAQVYVSVLHINSGTIYTEHQYDMVLTPSGSETAAFSHTFVIPTDDAYVVKVRLQHNRTARLKVFGGTVRSALSVNKWDSGTANAVILDTAPEGGALG